MDAGRCCALLAAAAAAAAAWAAPPPEIELPSCVDGSPPLRLPATAERTALDAADRRRFEAAAQARYPLYQRGGVVPAQVLMLRRAGRWQYVALWPAARGGLCVAAVFAADRFDFTPAWVAKYRPPPGDAAD